MNAAAGVCDRCGTPYLTSGPLTGLCRACWLGALPPEQRATELAKSLAAPPAVQPHGPVECAAKRPGTPGYPAVPGHPTIAVVCREIDRLKARA